MHAFNKSNKHLPHTPIRLARLLLEAASARYAPPSSASSSSASGVRPPSSSALMKGISPGDLADEREAFSSSRTHQKFGVHHHQLQRWVASIRPASATWC